MKAGFAYYRAIPKSSTQNQTFKKAKLTMPVLAIGGDHGANTIPIETMQLVPDTMQGVVIAQCGHYTPEECPEEFLQHVQAFLTA